MESVGAFRKYKPYPPVALPDRQWPARRIERAPIWCSVDLRDGNQALAVPMNVEEKLRLFRLLVSMGFKEIEIAFPSASETEFQFTRKLIDENLIPADVTIQVLTQARPHLIEKTFAALHGARRAVVHMYNSTSELQRRVVFKKDRPEIIRLAVDGARLIRELAGKCPETEMVFEYTPESFTGTELEYAREICDAVLYVWQPTPEKKAVINLPSTVEMSTPNVYADQVEWMSGHLSRRDSVILSVHPHNDRGTGVAAGELALLAGAERVEGTLFGNGERTGNADLVTIGMNMFSQGLDPNLDFSNLPEIVRVYEECMRMPVNQRSPYAGELVHTAFSGSHQDAIRKGLQAYQENQPPFWEVPYLPIDPKDVGCEYKDVIRINSQSGKGGAAFIMETAYGFKLPKAMHPEFGSLVQAEADRTGLELSGEALYQLFTRAYLQIAAPLQLVRYSLEEAQAGVTLQATLDVQGRELAIDGAGNGPIDAFCRGLQAAGLRGFRLCSYDEHALLHPQDEAGVRGRSHPTQVGREAESVGVRVRGTCGSPEMRVGSDASAVAYIGLESDLGASAFGVGVAANISAASLLAVLNALNRLHAQGQWKLD